MLVIDFHMVYNVYIIIYIHVYCLVVWNICYVSIQLGIILPFDELVFFRGVGIPPTSKILMDIIYHTTRGNIQQIAPGAFLAEFPCVNHL